MSLNNIISAIILVGGSGSRFSNINEPPKQLSKLNKDYILINIINNFKKFGLNHLIFPLGLKRNFFLKFFKSKKNISKYKFNILKENFKRNDLIKKKINISFFDAGKNTNKLNRIYKCLKFVQNENFIVAYGDDLSNINFNKIILKFKKYKSKKAIVTMYKKNSQYGHIVSNKKGEVIKFEEKPLHQHPINIGNYILTKKLIKNFRGKNRELELDLLPILSKKKLLVSYEHKGYFYSINDKKELIFAKKKLKNIK